MRAAVLLTWLLLPGAMLHELTHAGVAYPWADVRIEYRRAVSWVPLVGGTVHMHWRRDGLLWVVIATQVAPLMLGLWMAPAIAYGLLWALSVRLPLAFVGWVLLNWLLYIGLSGQDVGVARRVWRAGGIAREV